MKKILFIVVSLLIIIWGGVYYFVSRENTDSWDIQYSQSPNTEKSLSYAELREQIEEKHAKNIELYNLAIKEKDPRICEKITESSKKIECDEFIVAAIAQKNDNLDQCSALTNVGIATICKDAIYSDRAIQKNDSTLCKEISSSERQSSCMDLIDTKKLQEATEKKSLTEEFCNSLSEKQKSACQKSLSSADESSIYQDATRENNLELCKKLTDITLQDTCNTTISLKLALTTNNIILCDSIRDDQKKSYCKMQLSRNTDIETYKSAIATNTLEACQKIENKNLRDKCNDTIIFNSVKSTKDITLCDSINNTTLIPACKQIWQ